MCMSVCMRSCVYFVFPTGLSLEEVREYEQAMHEKTNSKVKSSQNNTGEVASPDLHCTEIPQRTREGDRRGSEGEEREYSWMGKL